MPGISSLAALFCLLVASPASAQPATFASLSGFVTDESNGQPLELVNVILRDEDGDLRGATTNRDGLFLITRLTPGAYAIEISYVGYRTYSDSLELAPGQSRVYNVALEPGDPELDEVVVETERPGGAARVTAGQQTIRPADVEYIPSPGLSADLAGYLTAQPGIVTSGDRGGQLFIRGGEPSQNLVQLDGILLYQPFHILGFYSAFPAEILSRVDVYAGGYGSRFGGRVSSVLDVATRNGNARRFAGTATASPFISSALIEGPIVRDRSSFLFSVRRSNVDEGAARYVDRIPPLFFGDVFAKLHTIVTDNSRLSVTGLSTFDRGILQEDTGGVPSEEIRWNNDAIGTRLLILPQVFAIMVEGYVSYSRLRSELGPPDQPSRFSQIENTYVGLDATYLGEKLTVQAGSSLRLTRIDSRIGGVFQNVDFRLSRLPHWGNYLEFDFDVGHGLRIRPGIRAQFYKVRFDPFLEPRLRMVWDRGRHQISAAAGLYHQEVIGLNDRRDAASVFTAWSNILRHDPNVEDVRQGKPQTALHTILGYRTSPFYWLDLSVEGFYKNLSSLFVSEWTAFPHLTTRLQPASGRSIGADFRVEVQGRNAYAFANYGLSSTVYEAMQETLMLWYGEEKMRFRPPHDRRHQVNLVVGSDVFGLDTSVRWEFGSGLPFSRALGFDGFALIEDVVKAPDVPETRRVIYERPFNAVLPDYHRLDVSVARSFRLAMADVTLQGSVINLYNRRNIFYLDVFTLTRVDQMPLIPTLSLKVAFD